MKRIAIIMTVHNRRVKTLRCLKSLAETSESHRNQLSIKVFLTDDGCTDGTADAIRAESYPFEVSILPGDGNLFWNDGMINSWRAALQEGGWDGFLWLNDDVAVLPAFWEDLEATDRYSLENFGKRGVYVGSTQDAATGAFTYGGFNYSSKITLKDQLLPPDGTVQQCEAGHGNITYVAAEVVDKQGIFCEKYIHGGTDHDYTYLAHKAGFPVLVLPHFSGACENDHLGKPRVHVQGNLRERLKYLNSPWGFKLKNTLLFNWRCFPWRVPFVFVAIMTKVLFPKFGHKAYLRLRGVK